LSFALGRIGPLAAIIVIVFYLLVLYSLALPNTPENLFASIYSESLIKTTCQHLLLLVGFNTLICQKYYDIPPILVGYQDYFLAPLPGSEALLKSGFGKGNRCCEYCFYFFLLLLFSFAMENSPFGFLFVNTSTTAAHADEPPPSPAQLDPFKIPMKIVERVMDNCYSGDGTVHPGDHLLYRDFYFHALGSLVVLSFPQLLSFSSVLSKPLSETVTSAGTAGCPTVEHL
jgi:hypothetical protein